MSSEEFDTAADPPFQQVQREMSRLMDQMQKGFYKFRPGETWTPSVNLYETDEEYLVCADLGGVDKEKIDIELSHQRLTIKGNRPVPTLPNELGFEDGKKYRVHLMEIDHGGFSREVELPLNVEKDRISAIHKNGMLWIILPKM